MIGVTMKGLIDKCGGFCQQALNSAAGMAVHREHYEVCLEHFLLACLEEARCDAALMLASAGVDRDGLRAAVNRALEGFRSGNSGRPVFSPTLQDVMEAGWLVSSVDLDCVRLRSGGMLLAFLRRPNFYAQGDYTRLLRDVEPDALLRGFGEVRASSMEEEDAAAPAAPDAAAASGAAKGAGEGFLARFWGWTWGFWKPGPRSRANLSAASRAFWTRSSARPSPSSSLSTRPICWWARATPPAAPTPPTS